jgi:hypothetical protein
VNLEKRQEGITPEFSLYAKVMVLFHWESNYWVWKKRYFWPTKNVYWIFTEFILDILNTRSQQKNITHPIATYFLTATVKYTNNFNGLRPSERNTYLRSFLPVLQEESHEQTTYVCTRDTHFIRLLFLMYLPHWFVLLNHQNWTIRPSRLPTDTLRRFWLPD